RVDENNGSNVAFWKSTSFQAICGSLLATARSRLFWSAFERASARLSGTVPASWAYARGTDDATSAAAVARDTNIMHLAFTSILRLEEPRAPQTLPPPDTAAIVSRITLDPRSRFQ